MVLLSSFFTFSCGHWAVTYFFHPGVFTVFGAILIKIVGFGLGFNPCCLPIFYVSDALRCVLGALFCKKFPGGSAPLTPWPGALPLDPAGAAPPDPAVVRIARRLRRAIWTQGRKMSASYARRHGETALTNNHYLEKKHKWNVS